MPSRKKQRAITRVKDQCRHRERGRWRDDRRRTPKSIHSRTRRETFTRNRQPIRVQRRRIDKSHKTHSRNRSANCFNRRVHQSTSSSRKPRGTKLSPTVSANRGDLRRTLDQRLNKKLPNSQFRQVPEERAKALESTATHRGFGSVLANTSTPGNQPITAITAEPFTYIPPPQDSNRSYGPLQNYRFLDHFVVATKF
ncbi:unnamed protein product [Rodentolepis nana]|uniref:Transformer n=1 Tax=Rodentolepis nana TaxID=102285 RepID=A0A0R3TTC5_RODNA|nr:unnamed protein product [Rodentolepis nana]